MLPTYVVFFENTERMILILIFYFYSTALYRTWAQYARTTSDRDIRVFSCLEYTLRAGTAFHRGAKYIVTLIHVLFQVTISTGGSVRYILSYLSSSSFSFTLSGIVLASDDFERDQTRSWDRSGSMFYKKVFEKGCHDQLFPMRLQL